MSPTGDQTVRDERNTKHHDVFCSHKHSLVFFNHAIRNPKVKLRDSKPPKGAHCLHNVWIITYGRKPCLNLGEPPWTFDIEIRNLHFIMSPQWLIEHLNITKMSLFLKHFSHV